MLFNSQLRKKELMRLIFQVSILKRLEALFYWGKAPMFDFSWDQRMEYTALVTLWVRFTGDLIRAVSRAQ